MSFAATAIPSSLFDEPGGSGADAADEAVAAAGRLPRRSFTEHHMAMPWSVHVRGSVSQSSRLGDLAATAFALVARLDRELSPFRPESALNAYRAGTLSLADGPESLRAVHRLCGIARERTDGVFDAWAWRDGFDPTGLTKGWAIAQVLALFDDLDGDVAVVASGDLAVRSSTGLPWRVGIEDPRSRDRLLGWVDVVDAGVATSGTAARGAHIVDPRGDSPRVVPGVLSATVVTAGIVEADVWATTAVALGGADWTRVRRVPDTVGLVLTDDGTLHRWQTPDGVRVGGRS